MQTTGSTDGGVLDAVRLGAALDRIVRMLRRTDLPGSLSPVGASTLYTLAAGEARRLSALAAGEHVTQPAMTQLVTRLEEHGLVSRAADPDDGRAVLVSITEAGAALSLERRAARAAALDELCADLDETQLSALAAALPAIETLAGLGDERHPA